MLAHKLLQAAGNNDGVDKLYVDDVFSAYTYTGNGSTQTINNGIDLAGEGGMVWIKDRNSAAYSHVIADTQRGVTNILFSNADSKQVPVLGGVSSVSGNGFTIESSGGVNLLNDAHVSWTFRKAPKFFDVVTYTGTGSTHTVTHGLGSVPGMVIAKCTNTAGSNWVVYHQGLTNTKAIFLNTTSAASTLDRWGNTTPTATAFTVGGSDPDINENGKTYVAYLFAHDPSADGIVQCGSFTTDGSGNATVNHGWSAGVQFAAIKASSTTGDWEMYDTARTAAWSGSDARLRANLSNAEDSVSRLSASGTSVSFVGLSASATYVYLFIVTPT